MTTETNQDPGQLIFPALYGEVVTVDVYRARSWKPAPDVVFDLGANIGIFTRFARKLFPHALIVAVEPDDANFEQLAQDVKGLPQIELVKKALGAGTIWRTRGAINGAHEAYVSPGLGYSLEELQSSPATYASCPEIESCLLSDLVAEYVKSDASYAIKMDCEGGENWVVGHEPSMAAMREAAFISIELHSHAAHGGLRAEVRATTRKALEDLAATHICEQEHVMFYARKRES